MQRYTSFAFSASGSAVDARGESSKAVAPNAPRVSRDHLRLATGERLTTEGGGLPESVRFILDEWRWTWPTERVCMLELLGKLSRFEEGVAPATFATGDRGRMDDNPVVGVAGTVARAARCVCGGEWEETR